MTGGLRLRKLFSDTLTRAEGCVRKQGSGNVFQFVGRWLTNNDDKFKIRGRNFAQHSDCTKEEDFGSIVACYIGFFIHGIFDGMRRHDGYFVQIY
jgi:hypothetical protein